VNWEQGSSPSETTPTYSFLMHLV